MLCCYANYNGRLKKLSTVAYCYRVKYGTLTSGAFVEGGLNDFSELSDEAICAVVGIRLKTERLRLGIKQTDMAQQCGVSLRTYKRFESTGKVGTETFVAVLRHLNKLKLLGVLLPEPSLPPQKTLRQTFERVRKRVRDDRKAETILQS